MAVSNYRLKGGFGQVSNAVMRDPTISIRDKGFYSYLCTYANSSTNELTLSMSRMTAELETTESTIKRCINSLKSKGVIEREFMGKGRTWKTTILK